MIAGLLAENVTVERVLELYPQLTAQDVRACQTYTAAQDRRERSTRAPRCRLAGPPRAQPRAQAQMCPFVKQVSRPHAATAG
jgi:hypothetical protein